MNIFKIDDTIMPKDKALMENAEKRIIQQKTKEINQRMMVFEFLNIIFTRNNRTLQIKIEINQRKMKLQ